MILVVWVGLGHPRTPLTSPLNFNGFDGLDVADMGMGRPWPPLTSLVNVSDSVRWGVVDV